MVANLRMRGIKDDLMRTAVELDALCQALAGHARYLQHADHGGEVQAMNGQLDGLRASADELRQAAASIRP
ncbi:hypothetical protein [Pseudomonas sp.]|uniref:hypothetical protein n=1 Tax=Pseudomonas sp. TaxID=306 RepID=UPI0028AF8F51|nr:hypothetical protein [Pseudomonas sp.]